MAYKFGRNCKVTIGASNSTITGMGSWSLNGITADQIDTSSFGTVWKTFQIGMLDGGTVEFSGLFNPDDQTGIIALMAANVAGTELTTLRLYFDNTSYFVPCRTTSYASPYDTSTANNPLSSVVVQSYSVTADKSDAVKVTVTGKVSGCMVMV